MKYIVYQTRNVVNNKIYIGVHKTKNPDVFDGYIGCGVTINNPSTYMHPTTPFQRAVKKYGTGSFKRSVLQIFESKQLAYALEAKIVNRDFIKRNDVYNSKLGGIGGCSNPRQIYQFNKDGFVTKIWETVADASEFLGVSATAIKNAIKYKGSCKNSFWGISSTINIKEFTMYEGSLCYQYDENGNYTETYNSLVEAAKANNVPLQSIQRAVKGGYKVGKYYYTETLYSNYTGKPRISLTKNPLYVYNLQGEYLITLNGKLEIMQYFNVKSISSIAVALRTGRQYKTYQLSNSKVTSLQPISNKKNISKKVGCFDKVGIMLEEFPSVTTARLKYGNGVQRVLKGQQQQCKGYIFKYIS